MIIKAKWCISSKTGLGGSSENTYQEALKTEKQREDNVNKTHKNLQIGRHSTKLQMQGAHTPWSEAYYKCAAMTKGAVQSREARDRWTFYKAVRFKSWPLNY
ncbi:MAG: hypothetical protein A2Y79_11610 [Deltaproteobacteria bacterium RBG_13_43_22]|nr:MAG: hypothetical protein A2Y79_11610 [Deltaproteobacteria bacterium RBG_13_43_22]